MSVTQTPARSQEETRASVSLPVVQATPAHDHVHRDVHKERERLMQEAGLSLLAKHFTRPRERRFTRAEREFVTILTGGLTVRHDELIDAAVRGLGYKVERLAVPTKSDCQAGKEYG